MKEFRRAAIRYEKLAVRYHAIQDMGKVGEEVIILLEGQCLLYEQEMAALSFSSGRTTIARNSAWSLKTWCYHLKNDTSRFAVGRIVFS
jgi:hypothetical protein